MPYAEWHFAPSYFCFPFLLRVPPASEKDFYDVLLCRLLPFFPPPLMWSTFADTRDGKKQCVVLVWVRVCVRACVCFCLEKEEEIFIYGVHLRAKAPCSWGAKDISAKLRYEYSYTHTHKQHTHKHTHTHENADSSESVLWEGICPGVCRCWFIFLLQTLSFACDASKKKNRFPRTEGISTSDLIKRIVSRANEFT